MDINDKTYFLLDERGTVRFWLYLELIEMQKNGRKEIKVVNYSSWLIRGNNFKLTEWNSNNLFRYA